MKIFLARLRYRIISAILGPCAAGHKGYRTIDGDCDRCFLDRTGKALREAVAKLEAA